MSRRLLWWCFTCLFMPSSLLFAQQAPPRAGCYQFDTVHFVWPVPAPPGASPAMDSTSVIQLFAKSNDQLNRPVPGAKAFIPIRFVDDPQKVLRQVAMSYWTSTANGGVKILWFNGFSGLDLSLQSVGDTLRGQVEYLTDVRGAATVKRNAVAVRVTCPG